MIDLRKLIWALGVVGGLLWGLPLAQAQQVVKPCVPVVSSASGVTVTSCQDVSATNPMPVTTGTGAGATTTNASGSITSGGSFQEVFAASTSRKGCTIENTSTHTMYVYFGAIASATDATSVALTPNQAVNCASGGIVLTDQVSVDGTTSDTFYAGRQ